MLTQSQIDGMRLTLNESLPGTAVISRGTFIPDGGGGGSTGWQARATLDARLSPMPARGTGQETVEGERLTEKSEWIVTLPVGDVADSLDEADRIAIEGRTFAVFAIRGPRSYEIGRRVEVREVQS